MRPGHRMVAQTSKPSERPVPQAPQADSMVVVRDEPPEDGSE